MMQRWRRGIGGAFRLGIHHGMYCLGCCWAMMLILFAGGVMNLAVIIALTLWVIVEKFAPFGERTARVTGVALLYVRALVDDDAGGPVALGHLLGCEADDDEAETVEGEIAERALIDLEAH